MYAHLFRRGRFLFQTGRRLMSTDRNAGPDPRHQTSLISIGPCRCRYIVSESTRDAVCCGAPTTSDLSSWCAYHTRLVYEPRLPRSEREQRRAA